MAGQMRIHQLPPFQRQFRFDPVRRWTVDFAFPQHKLIVEFEGGVWRRGGGAHSHPTNIMRDIEKYNAATLAGWSILRFTDLNVKDFSAIETIKLFIQSKSTV